MHNYLNKKISLSDEQLAVINGKPNIIVKGVAGTGKTMAAIYLASKLSNENNTVAIIVVTNSLRDFIKGALTDAKNVIVCNTFSFNYVDDNYDYVIIDEVQDLSMKEVNLWKQKAIKGCYFFGDDNQKIYDRSVVFKNEETITIENLAKETGFPIIELITNVRINKTLGEFILANLPASFHSVSNFDNSIKPLLINACSQQEELEKISELINKNELTGHTAILLEENDFKTFGGHVLSIPQIFDYLLAQGVKNLGYKYKSDATKLNFHSSSSVNIMTIHSSKGLEFDNVILPFSNLGTKWENKKIIYVAITRLTGKLIISYYGTNFWQIELGLKKLIDGIILRRDLLSDIYMCFTIALGKKAKLSFNDALAATKEIFLTLHPETKKSDWLSKEKMDLISKGLSLQDAHIFIMDNLKRLYECILKNNNSPINY